jgi:hypothetical protein
MKLLAKSLIAVSVLGIACSAATVTISQPTASTTTSPLQVSAVVSGTSRVLQLYVDGNKVTETLTRSLNYSVPLTTGQHRIAVQSADYNNAITKTVKYVTIQTPTTSTQPPTTSTSTYTTFANLQESTNWKTCGTCGNQSGNTSISYYDMIRGLTTPAIDNTSTSSQFSISGQYAYTNAYWYLSNTAPKTTVKSLVYDFWIYVPAASVSAPQAIEFECQHTVNGYTYNFAWQADYGRKQWRTFDYINRVWVATSVPFTVFSGDTWHHIIAEYHENGTNSVHDALTIDGVRTVVNVTRPAKYTGQTWASFTNAFQLDMNSKPTAFSVYVDKMNVKYQ